MFSTRRERSFDSSNDLLSKRVHDRGTRCCFIKTYERYSMETRDNAPLPCCCDLLGNHCDWTIVSHRWKMAAGNFNRFDPSPAKLPRKRERGERNPAGERRGAAGIGWDWYLNRTARTAKGWHPSPFFPAIGTSLQSGNHRGVHENPLWRNAD